VPLFDLLSQQDGVDLPSMETLRERRTLRVEHAMRRIEGLPLLAEEPAIGALKRVEELPEPFLLVSYPAGGWNGLAKEDLRRAAETTPELLVRDIAESKPIPHLYSDQPLDEALRRIGNWPLLPVVNRAKFRKLEGVISLDDILDAYRKASSS
jgi:CIC family chloride channel protein